MKRVFLSGLVVLTVILAGCTISYTDSAVTGTIDGESFTFVDGVIDSDGFVEMYDEAKDFSSLLSYSTTYPYVMFTLPEIAVGQYDLNFNLLKVADIFTVTGVSSDIVNVIFTDGYVEITEVTDTTVSGGMYIEQGSDVLDGTFTLEVASW